jgi:hypothetical protein
MLAWLTYCVLGHRQAYHTFLRVGIVPLRFEPVGFRQIEQLTIKDDFLLEELHTWRATPVQSVLEVEYRLIIIAPFHLNNQRVVVGP